MNKSRTRQMPHTTSTLITGIPYKSWVNMKKPSRGLKRLWPLTRDWPIRRESWRYPWSHWDELKKLDASSQILKSDIRKLKATFVMSKLIWTQSPRRRKKWRFKRSDQHEQFFMLITGLIWAKKTFHKREEQSPEICSDCGLPITTSSRNGNFNYCDCVWRTEDPLLRENGYRQSKYFGSHLMGIWESRD